MRPLHAFIYSTKSWWIVGKIPLESAWTLQCDITRYFIEVIWIEHLHHATVLRKRNAFISWSYVQILDRITYKNSAIGFSPNSSLGIPYRSRPLPPLHPFISISLGFDKCIAIPSQNRRNKAQSNIDQNSNTSRTVPENKNSLMHHTEFTCSVWAWILFHRRIALGYTFFATEPVSDSCLVLDNRIHNRYSYM